MPPSSSVIDPRRGVGELGRRRAPRTCGAARRGGRRPRCSVTWRGCRSGSGSNVDLVGLPPVAKKPSRLSISSKLMEPPPLIATSSGVPASSGSTTITPRVIRPWWRSSSACGISSSVYRRSRIAPRSSRPGHEQVDELGEVPTRVDRAAVGAGEHPLAQQRGGVDRDLHRAERTADDHAGRARSRRRDQDLVERAGHAGSVEAVVGAPAGGELEHRGHRVGRRRVDPCVASPSSSAFVDLAPSSRSTATIVVAPRKRRAHHGGEPDAAGADDDDARARLHLGAHHRRAEAGARRRTRARTPRRAARRRGSAPRSARARSRTPRRSPGSAACGSASPPFESRVVPSSMVPVKNGAVLAQRVVVAQALEAVLARTDDRADHVVADRDRGRRRRRTPPPRPPPRGRARSAIGTGTCAADEVQVGVAHADRDRSSPSPHPARGDGSSMSSTRTSPGASDTTTAFMRPPSWPAGARNRRARTLGHGRHARLAVARDRHAVDEDVLDAAWARRRSAAPRRRAGRGRGAAVPGSSVLEVEHHEVGGRARRQSTAVVRGRTGRPARR